MLILKNENVLSCEKLLKNKQNNLLELNHIVNNYNVNSMEIFDKISMLKLEIQAIKKHIRKLKDYRNIKLYYQYENDRDILVIEYPSNISNKKIENFMYNNNIPTFSHNTNYIYDYDYNHIYYIEVVKHKQILKHRKIITITSFYNC